MPFALAEPPKPVVSEPECETHVVRAPAALQGAKANVPVGVIKVCPLGSGYELAYFLGAPLASGGACVVRGHGLVPRRSLGPAGSGDDLYWRWSQVPDRPRGTFVQMARGPKCPDPGARAYVTANKVTVGEFLKLSGFWSDLRAGRVDVTSWMSLDPHRPWLLDAQSRKDLAVALSPAAHLGEINKSPGRKCPYELNSMIAPAEMIRVDIAMTGGKARICSARYVIR